MPRSTPILPLKITLSLLAATCCLPAAYAASMKAGLWEMTMQSDAIQSMPKIPPEQLEKMKQMGIKMPMMENGAMVHQVCISKEMAEQNQPPMTQKDQSGCKSQNVSQSGNTYSLDLICDSPDLKGKGTVKGSYNGSNSLHSTYDFKGMSHGTPVTQHMETTGKWLSSDCGEVKPAGNFQPKK